MSDLREAIRRAADRHEPPKDWLDRIGQRARLRRRNRRVFAAVVGIGLSLLLFIALAEQFRAHERRQPGGPRPSPAIRSGLGIDVSPTGWWRADGSPADEIAGRDAVLRGGAGYAPGVIGQAFALDGKDAFVEVPDDPALNVGSGDFTVSLWVRFRSKRGPQVFVEDWVQRGREDSVGWTFQKLGSGGILFTLEASAGSVGTGRLSLPLDTWIHVAARRRAGTLSVFVNGEVVATAVLSDPEVSMDSPASLKFGHRGGSRDTPGSVIDQGFFLNGDLDEIALFVGHGLTDAQIRRIFETQTAYVT